MSHFSVLVATATDDIEELERALQPYHEYECTGHRDEYVKFVDETDNMTNEFNTGTISVVVDENNKIICLPHDIQNKPEALEVAHIKDIPFSEYYKDLETWVRDYHGYGWGSNFKDGKIGRMTNPNAQWDWWVVGGRWSNFLILKDGSTADSAQKKDIFFEKKIKQAEITAATYYDKQQAIIAGQSFAAWDTVREDMGFNIEDARTFYHAQPVIVRLKAATTDRFQLISQFDDLLKDRKQYIHDAGLDSISTYAAVIDGKWLQNGQMGWFGMSHDENNNWDKDFGQLLDGIPDNHYITIVDCHI